MPKDFSKGLIYKIYCKDEFVKDIYVGQTTDIIRRRQSHKMECSREKRIYKSSNEILYRTINNNGCWDNWIMEKIEDFPCHTNKELLERESHFIVELNATLNKATTKTIKEYKKEWYDTHREVVREKQREYREAVSKLYRIDMENLENNPQWFLNNVLNSNRIKV